MGLEVTSEGMIRIRAPYGVAEDVILRFLESKSAWIQKSLAKVRARQERLKEEEEPVEKVEIPKAENIGTSLGDLFKNITL